MLRTLKYLIPVLALLITTPASAQGFGSGLLLGLLFGGDNDNTAVTTETKESLTRIPLRCLPLVESDEAAYRACRLPSMRAELMAQSRTAPSGRSPCSYIESDYSPDTIAKFEAKIKKLGANEKDLWREDKVELESARANLQFYKRYLPLCNVDQHITWEIAALKQLAEQAKAAQAAKAKQAN